MPFHFILKSSKRFNIKLLFCVILSYVVTRLDNNQAPLITNFSCRNVCYTNFNNNNNQIQGPVSQRHGRTTILRSSYDATFIFSRLSYDRFTKLVVKGS